MLTRLRAWILRVWYRYLNWRAWRAPNVHDSQGAVELPGASGPVRGHLYRGRRADDRPLVIYFHGGGWIIGDLQTHHAYCTALSEASGASVIAVDYRRAPEHPFPAAQDDALAATREIAARLADFGGSNGGLILAGDSAGAQLALATALSAEEALAERLRGVIASYPVVDHYSAGRDSYVECARGQTLTASLMRWFWDTYLAGADPEAAASQRAFPIRSAALAKLPPVLLCTAGRDPLRDEGRALVEKLREVGVATDFEHFPDAEHGFACSLGPTDDYAAWLARCADFIIDRGWIRSTRS
jgi:acetyl esterase